MCLRLQQKEERWGGSGLQKIKTLVMGFCPGHYRPGCHHCPHTLLQPLGLERTRAQDSGWSLGALGLGHSCSLLPLSSLPHTHPGSFLLATVCLSLGVSVASSSQYP